MTDAVTRRWQEADDAVESLVETLAAAVARAERGQSRKRRGPTRPKRHTKSTRRYLAEVIRSHRLAPGLTVDRNMVAALFTGHRELVANPVLVVAVAQACGIIAGRKVTVKEAARLRASSERVAKLIARAQASGSVPAPAPPVPLQTPVPLQAPVPLQQMPVPLEASVPPDRAVPLGAPVPLQTPVPFETPVPFDMPVPLQPSIPLQQTSQPFGTSAPLDRAVPVETSVPRARLPIVDASDPVQQHFTSGEQRTARGWRWAWMVAALAVLMLLLLVLWVASGR